MKYGKTRVTIPTRDGLRAHSLDLTRLKIAKALRYSVLCYNTKHNNFYFANAGDWDIGDYIVFNSEGSVVIFLEGRNGNGTSAESALSYIQELYNSGSIS